MTIEKKRKRELRSPNRVDQAVALARAIREKDPNLEHAFTPEEAEAIANEEDRKKKGG